MSRIYVSRLPAEMNNQEALAEVMVQRTGVVPKNIINRPNYALIDLPDDLTVEKAVELLNGYEIMGSQLIVEPSQNRRGRGTYIQITNIPEQYPWDDFTTFLSNFGSFQYIEKGPSRQNGYSALVTYENQEQAQQAHIQLNNCEIQPGSYLKASPPMDRRPPRRSGPFPRPLGPPYKPSEFPVRILVLSDMVGAIIGRAGGTIRQITQQSRARVDVHRKENAGSPEKVITIYGAPENCSTACLKIMEIMQQEANATNRGEIPLKLLAHNALIGRIIGKNGNVIKRIMETSETKIAVSSNIHDCSSWNLERVITIKGRVESMHKAERMISSKLRQNYEFDMNCVTRAPQYLYPGALNPMAAMMAPRPASPYGPSPFHHPPPPPMGAPGGPDMHHQKETVFVYVPHTSVGAIIGTGGSNIREMISCSGASIKVTQPDKDDPAEKLTERKVCIVGTPDAQWKAQFMIFKRIAYEGFHGPQEAPLKVEISVPTNQVGRIIGKGGATVRELQRMTHASIKFPEDGRNSESEETAVHIVGEFFCAMAAQRQIRSLVIRSNNFHLRRQQQQQLPLQQSN